MAAIKDLRLDRLEEHYTRLSPIVKNIGEDVSLIKGAIIGNELSGDKGMQGKLEKMQKIMQGQEDEIEKLKENRIKYLAYINIIIWAGGIAGSSVLIYAVQKILTR